jgi:hypothetical protein
MNQNYRNGIRKLLRYDGKAEISTDINPNTLDMENNEESKSLEDMNGVRISAENIKQNFKSYILD